MRSICMLTIILLISGNLFAKELFSFTEKTEAPTQHHSNKYNQTLSFLPVPESDMSAKKSLRYKKAVLKTINSVNSFIPKTWIAPKLEVQMTGVFNNAFQKFDYIYIPRQLSIGGLFKHPNKTIPVVRHEYGHDVFSEMMSGVSKSWKKNQEIIPKYMKVYELIEKVQKAYPLMAERYNQIFNDPKHREEALHLLEQLEKLEVILKQAVVKFEALEKQIDVKILNLSGSYNEFFADVIAVLGSQDQTTSEMNPEAISDALLFAGYYELGKKSLAKYQKELVAYELALKAYENGDTDVEPEKPEKPKTMKQKKHVNNYRNFEQKVRIKGWSNDKVHTELNPTRYFFWKYYLDNPLIRRQRKKIIVQLAKAIVEEMKTRHKLDKSEDGSGSPEYSNSQKVNERLISTIKKTFKDF